MNWLLDWPSALGGEYQVLRKGSSEWTGLSGIPDIRTMSQDVSFPFFCTRFRTTWRAVHRRIDRIDISYLYAGAWVKQAKTSSSPEFHVGPHLMARS